MRRSVAIVSVLALGGLASAQPAAAVDPLLAGHDTDPLELARVVDRIGDDAVLARLAPETPIAVRVLAVSATPRLHAPEAALPTLAELAGGRDPDLAPRALQAISEIARSLDARSLDARESERAELRAVLPRLTGIGEDESARADLRRAAAEARIALERLATSE